MGRQLLNLPVNIPWKQIAVSPDMMDRQFCNKRFPFAWRSSLAISVYEPRPEELPEELCGDRITYLKITATITGYQPTKEETERLNALDDPLITSFPNVPTEDIRSAIDRIINEYFACYGVLLNVAVFPYPTTKKQLTERLRIVFGQLEGVEPESLLDNPYVHPTGVTFEAADQDSNRIADIFPEGGDGNGELDLRSKMVITLPDSAEAVEAKLVHYAASGITMAAFEGSEPVGTETSSAEQGQVHRLYIEGQGIDRIVFTAPDNEASLLEFAYFVGPAGEIPVELENYPHIIDFEPKVRDLYQAATETGEVLTGSKSGIKVDKSLTHTESTESSLSLGASIKIPIPGTPVTVGSEASTSRTNTETDQEQWAVQTDASRERRETQGTTTQLSQMYNLLTGYHAGTNRDVHLMLARPHVLQPTDRRTFVQGLRAIEGMQEFFLVVARPGDIKGLCIDAFLETGHFPEDVYIEAPEQQFDQKQMTFDVGPIKVSPSWGRRQSKPFQETRTIFNVSDEWAFDFAQGDGGLEEERLTDDNAVGDSTSWAGTSGKPHLENYSYATEEPNNVVVTGTIRSRSGSSTTFHRRYRVHLRRPKQVTGEPSANVGKLLITNRGLCACFKSEKDCPEVVTPPVPRPPYVESIVDEPIIRVNPALLTRKAVGETRLPAVKELLAKIQAAMSTSWRVPRRRAFGEVGFLESDYFKDRIKNLVPDARLQAPLTRVRGLPEAVVRSLGEESTVAEALDLDLASFASKTDLSIAEAVEARNRLLGISAETGPKSKQ